MNERTPTPASPQARGISRRTVAAGAAWAVPAVLFAGAAPAFATSPVLDGEIKTQCKYPGNSHGGNCKQSYLFSTTWTNHSSQNLQVSFTATIQSAGLTVGSMLVDGVPYPGGTVTLSPGKHTIEIVAGNNSSPNLSGLVSVTGTYVYNGNTYHERAEKYFDTTPPECPEGCITGG